MSKIKNPIEEIKLAENTAAKKLAVAEKKAERAKIQAAARAEKELEFLEEKLAPEAAKLDEKFLSEAQAEAAQIEKDSVSILNAIEKTASKNMKKAVKLVIDHIVKGHKSN